MHGVNSSLAGRRFNDLHHTSITMLSDSQASDSILLAIAGHVSRRMLEHYSHIRMDAKRTALDALRAAPKVSQTTGGGTVTSQNHVINERDKDPSN
jgi:hypothetical protein